MPASWNLQGEEGQADHMFQPITGWMRNAHPQAASSQAGNPSQGGEAGIVVPRGFPRVSPSVTSSRRTLNGSPI